ncbi:unnamed protein product [Rotaria socialis]
MHMIFKLVIFTERSFFYVSVHILHKIYSFPGTSGQDLDDIDLQSTIESRVQILEDCLKWSAIAPTRPNTLRPNGIQVRLICIPYFAESNSCIALNLSTLECYEI